MVDVDIDDSDVTLTLLSSTETKRVDIETDHEKRDEEQSKMVLQLRQEVVTLSNKSSRANNDLACAQAITKEQNKATSHRCESQSEITLLTHRIADAKRSHEQILEIMKKRHANELLKLQIDSETRNRAHVAECEQLSQRVTDAIQRLETKHCRELRSAHEESENHDHQLRTEMQTMIESHSKALVSADCNLTQINPSPR